MSWSFNPFTGNLDLVGSGGGSTVFEGEVATFADLPVTIGDPAVGAAFLVRDSTGVWLVNRRQAGIYIRRYDTGVAATDWEYGGDYPVNSVNGQSGNVVLGAADVGAASATHASNHHTGGTDALAAHQINGQTIFSTASATYSSDQTLTANRARQVTISNTNASGINVTLPTGVDGTLLGDTFVLVGGSPMSGPVAIRRVNVLNPLIYETVATITAAGQQYRFRASGGSTGSWLLVPVDTHTHAASAITSGTFDNARINFAAPSSIGSTTPAAGTFTTLTANNGIIAADAPALTVSQTWNNSAVAFTGLRINITNTLSSASSYYQEWQEGGVTQAAIRSGGFLYLRSGRIASPVGGGWAESAAFLYNAQSRINSTSLLIGSGSSGAGSLGVTLATEGNVEHVLALRNALNPQTFRIYGQITGTDVSATGNYERGFMRWSAAGGVFQIGTEKGSGGGTARALEFQTDGVSRWVIDTTGRLVSQVAGAGAGIFSYFQGGFNIVSIAGGTSAIARFYGNNGHTRISSSETSLCLEIPRLTFNGTTSAFPALKRSSTALQVRLADDSAFTAIQAGNLVLTDNTGSETATFDAQGKLTANRTYDLPNASGTLALTSSLTDTQIFTANGTWTKPAGAKLVHYLLIGGGGGGGSGRRSLQNNSLCGGGGGAGGGLTTNFVNASFLGSTETITIGAGGAGAADSADNTNGVAGTAGGDSSIGSSIIAKGGNAGGGGSSLVGAAGTATTLASLFYGTNSSTSIGSASSASSTLPSAQAPTSLFLPSGGGGGGSRHSSTNVLGGKGGDIGQTNTGITAAPAVAAGTAGPTGITSHSNYAGTGGGGGCFENSDNSGRAGGNGGLYGGGGGGGSGAVNSTGGSTAGGDGANGIVIITTYF